MSGQRSKLGRYPTLPLDVERIASYFRYERDTGLLFRLKPTHGWADITKPAGCRRRRGDNGKPAAVTVRLCGTHYAVHRLAWVLETLADVPDGYVVDHINGDPFDNRWENLRLATVQQNSFNSSSHRADLPKGVSEADGKYRAAINVSGQERYLGRFDRLKDAAEAYRAAADELHGKFARRA